MFNVSLNETEDEIVVSNNGWYQRLSYTELVTSDKNSLGIPRLRLDMTKLAQRLQEILDDYDCVGCNYLTACEFES